MLKIFLIRFIKYQYKSHVYRNKINHNNLVTLCNCCTKVYARTVKKPSNILRKVAVLIAGIPLLILGVILIPLPGPGILICIVALFILSLEFDVAKPYLEKAKAKLRPLIVKFKDEYDKLKD